MIVHPAKLIPFDDLIDGLEFAVAQGLVNTRKLQTKPYPSGPILTQWTYTQKCVYDGAWSFFTEIARGIITDHERIVALPFPKFFNLSENKTIIPNLPFKVHEKVDGSLIIVYFYDGKWNTATKGSFISNQAWAAKDYMDRHIKFPDNYNNTTFLFEYVGPQNKIVVNYKSEEMILLGAYDNLTGEEWNDDALANLSRSLSQRMASRFEALGDPGLNSIVACAATLGGDQEGYVLRFENGTRVKIKGAEYCRLHKLISNITPLAIWESMMNHDNIDLVRREIPEEFLPDFDQIYKALWVKLMTILDEVELVYENIKEWSDKEVGLKMLDKYHPFSEPVKKLIFPRRKYGSLLKSQAREALFRLIRPTGNKLDGYEPSSSMNRIQDDF